MKPALAATDFGFRPMNLDEVGDFVREKSLYPEDGKSFRVGEWTFANIMKPQPAKEVEKRINGYAQAMNNANESVRIVALMESATLAVRSEDPYELHYMAGMFIAKRDLLRVIARNPAVAERTQLVILESSEFGDDHQVVGALAHNPNLSPAVMLKIADRTRNPYVLQGLAFNAVRNSLRHPAESAYADVCKHLAMSPFYSVSKEAIHGVKDPEILREIAATNSKWFSPGKLGAVAGNQYTPDDVLQELAKPKLAGIQQVLGMDIIERATSTLAAKSAARRASNLNQLGF